MNGDRDVRVVITGIGVVSPLGNDLETFWSNLVAGKSGVDTITHFDPAGYVTGQVWNVDGGMVMA